MVDIFAVIAVAVGCLLFGVLCCYLICDPDDSQDEDVK